MLTITCLGTAHGLLNFFRQWGQYLWLAPDGSSLTLYTLIFRPSSTRASKDESGLSTPADCRPCREEGVNCCATRSAVGKEPSEEILLSSPQDVTVATAMVCVRRRAEDASLVKFVWFWRRWWCWLWRLRKSMWIMGVVKRRKLKMKDGRWRIGWRQKDEQIWMNRMGLNKSRRWCDNDLI